MKIAVGSEGPAKVSAVRAVAAQVFPHAEIVALPVESGVPDLPGSPAEAVQGAVSRARRALQQTRADLGVGIEDGVEDTPFGTFLGGWVAVVDQKGRTGLGGGLRIALPEEVAPLVRAGQAQAVYERVGKGQDRVWGTIGWLTCGLVTREEAHRHAVAAALVPFLPDS
ncbi:MAG: DUF84 family protein [Armatimonadetes bacterium]|nr:DUF84 family protein [Armatimonadota bacterium]